MCNTLLNSVYGCKISHPMTDYHVEENIKMDIKIGTKLHILSCSISGGKRKEKKHKSKLDFDNNNEERFNKWYQKIMESDWYFCVLWGQN